MKRLVAIASLGAALLLTPALAASVTTLPLERPATACQVLPSLDLQGLAPGLRSDDLRIHNALPALTLSAAKLQAIRIGATGK